MGARGRRCETGVRFGRGLDKGDGRLSGGLAAGRGPESDRIEPEIVISDAARARIEAANNSLATAGVPEDAIHALTTYLTHASDQDVARIRPLELAQKFGVSEDAMIDAALHAARGGLLALVWDVICPSCRIPSTVVDSLQQIEEHSSCKACNLGL